MANVYIVNLKDNRENHDKNDDAKFLACMDNELIAIGWGSETSREEANAKIAINVFNEMQNGDYVWTKNPADKNKFHLLKIIDDKAYDYLKTEKEYYVDEDRSLARKVKEIGKFSADALPNGLKKNDIVARHTAERVHRQFLLDVTLDFVKSKGE